MKDEDWPLTEKLSKIQRSLITNKTVLSFNNLNQYQPLHVLIQRKINFNNIVIGILYIPLCIYNL